MFFFDERREINETEHSRPDYSRLIEIDPAHELKVCIVIPAYKELHSGNIFRLLESFSRQTLPKDVFEIILIINNPNFDEEEKTSKGFDDNKKTLQIIHYLEDKIPVESLSFLGLEEKKKIEQIKSTGLVVHAIDYTERDHMHTMGALRDDGVRTAITRLKKMGKERGIIANGDADMVVKTNYLQNIIEAFGDDNVDALFIERHPFPTEHTTDTIGSMYAERATEEVAMLERTLSRNYTPVDTPQIAFRVSTYDKKSFSREDTVDEDFKFAEKLVKAHNIHITTKPNIEVYCSDRKRPESFDGELGSSAAYEQRSNIAKTIPPTLRLLYLKFLDVFKDPNKDSTEVYSVIQDEHTRNNTIFLDDTLRQAIEQHIQSGKGRNLLQGQLLISNYIVKYSQSTILPSSNYVDQWIDVLRSQIDEDEQQKLNEYIESYDNKERQYIDGLVRLLKKSIETCDISDETSLIAALNRLKKHRIVGEFFTKNDSFIQSIPNIVATLEKKTPEKLWQILISMYPDILGEYDISPHRKTWNHARALTTFIIQAQTDKYSFSSTNKFVERVRSIAI